jgi:hypothetical protein
LKILKERVKEFLLVFILKLRLILGGKIRLNFVYGIVPFLFALEKTGRFQPGIGGGADGAGVLQGEG